MNFNRKKIGFFIIENYLYIGLFFYTLASILLLIILKGNIYQITSDFDFYNGFIHRFTNLETSELSKDLFEKSILMDPNPRKEWIPTPFYSIILSKIFLANKFTQYSLGLFIGNYQIYLFDKILKKDFFKFNKFNRSWIIILISLNIYFVMDSVSFSSMSLASFFIIFGVASDSNSVRKLFFCFAAMTRSNYLFFIFPIFIASIFVNRKFKKNIFYNLLPSILVYLIFYFNFYSTYPGNIINYFFMTSFQGIDYTVEAFTTALNERLNLSVTKDDIFITDISIKEFFKLISDLHILNLVFQAWILKISITLGFIHERVFTSGYNIWLAKLARSVYACFILIPSFYSTNILLISNKTSQNEKFVYFSALLYILLNSLLIADPRYSIGAYFVIVSGGIKVLSILIKKEPQKIMIN